MKAWRSVYQTLFIKPIEGLPEKWYTRGSRRCMFWASVLLFLVNAVVSMSRQGTFRWSGYYFSVLIVSGILACWLSYWGEALILAIFQDFHAGTNWSMKEIKIAFYPIIFFQVCCGFSVSMLLGVENLPASIVRAMITVWFIAEQTIFCRGKLKEGKIRCLMAGAVTILFWVLNLVVKAVC